MGAKRTQIYLTANQRRELDAIGTGAGLSLAEMIRHAVDQYLAASPDFGPALDASFGTLPTLQLKGRGEAATLDLANPRAPSS